MAKFTYRGYDVIPDASDPLGSFEIRKNGEVVHYGVTTEDKATLWIDGEKKRAVTLSAEDKAQIRAEAEDRKNG